MGDDQGGYSFKSCKDRAQGKNSPAEMSGPFKSLALGLRYKMGM